MQQRAFTYNTIEGHGFRGELSPLHLCVHARDASGFIALVNHSGLEHAWICRLLFTAPNLLLLAVEANSYDIVKYILSGEIKLAYKDAGLWPALAKNALMRCRKRARELSHIRELLKPYEKLADEQLAQNSKKSFELYVTGLPLGIDASQFRDFVEENLADQIAHADTDPAQFDCGIRELESTCAPQAGAIGWICTKHHQTFCNLLDIHGSEFRITVGRYMVGKPGREERYLRPSKNAFRVGVVAGSHTLFSRTYLRVVDDVRRLGKETRRRDGRNPDKRMTMLRYEMSREMSKDSNMLEPGGVVE